MPVQLRSASETEELARFVSQYADDPLGFVYDCFPWGEPGPLEDSPGPDVNQIELLTALGKEVRERNFDGHTSCMPVQMAAASGHGTGKSAMGGWLACWILSTRPGSIGTVTAGTATQLSERTWAAICWWLSLCVTAEWFEPLAGGIYAYADPNNWKVVAQTSKEENAQSFAGQHARTSTSWYLFDEASLVPDGVWKVAKGGLTDGEPMFFAWGQPERNSGMFYEVCFGKERHRWNFRGMDSRSSRLTNKETIDEWIRDYGEDSDWVRVRVRGLPPRASELQYIDKARIEMAQSRQVYTLPSDPLIVGVDVSGGGAAFNVVRFRRGLDARSIAPIRIPGEHGRDRETLIALLAELLRDRRPERAISAMFVDAAFGAPIVERLHVLGYEQAIEVSFGGASLDPHFLNQRAYMAKECKDWLLRGAIDPHDEKLAEELAIPGYKINSSSKLVIESKQEIVKRLGRSPDDSDALWLTFAQPVAPPEEKQPARRPGRAGYGGDAWMR